MKKKSSLYNHVKHNLVTSKRPDQINISFTQYSSFKECPHRWFLTYGQKMYPFTSNINSVFGTAIHETIQSYLHLLYEESVSAADEYKMFSSLYENMVKTYKAEVKKNNGKHFCNQPELEEYYEDGKKILDYLRKKRKVLFETKDVELLGTEIPIFVPLFDDNDKFVFNAFVDVGFYFPSLNRIKVIDIKTSTKGWSDYQKKDEVKANQVRLYKRYLSKITGVPEENIDVEFLILKRKIYEDSEWPIPRHQIIKPTQGLAKINFAEQDIKNFVNEAYLPDGTVNINNAFPKKPSNNTCRFCPYAGTEHCDMNKG